MAAAGHAIGGAARRGRAARKADLLRACEERARAAGAEVTQVRIGYSEARRQVEVFNSEAVPRPTTARACASARR